MMAEQPPYDVPPIRGEHMYEVPGSRLRELGAKERRLRELEKAARAVGEWFHWNDCEGDDLADCEQCSRLAELRRVLDGAQEPTGGGER